jgi:hypothetical protein
MLYKGLTDAERKVTTIGVTRIKINGEWKEVVAVNGRASSSAIAKIQLKVQADGGLFRVAPRGAHADTYLYDAFGHRDGFQAIGLSHYKGPCKDICKPYFIDQGFFNVFWDNTFLKG